MKFSEQKWLKKVRKSTSTNKMYHLFFSFILAKVPKITENVLWSGGKINKNRERLLSVPFSPSKRKSTQPKRYVPVHQQKLHSMEIMANSDKRSAIESNTEIAAKNMIGDSAVADASDVTTTQNPHLIWEESVEAVEVRIDAEVEIVLMRCDEIELNMQDVISDPKEMKTVCNEPTSSSECFGLYGRPLHTTTPLPKKNLPKFNKKHKYSAV